MKIVEFNDGKFGVRRRHLGLFWYEYATICGSWISIFLGKENSYVHEFCHHTYKDAERTIENFKRHKLKNDYGIAVKTKEAK